MNNLTQQVMKKSQEVKIHLASCLNYNVLSFIDKKYTCATYIKGTNIELSVILGNS